MRGLPDEREDNTNDTLLSRRKAIVGSGAILSWLRGCAPVFAGNEVSQLITVIGANGRTGKEVVRACQDRGTPVRATSRSGEYFGEGQDSKLLSTMACDVTKPDSITPSIQGSKAVIFAASGSTQGGTPAQVDNAGLVSVARACIACKVPHLIIVSSGSVTKPDSLVYKFLNLFGNIMTEKIRGEDAVRELYKNAGDEVMYTVIRPGGLTEEEGKGVSALELNQGDTKSGRISRADVASLCVEAANFPTLTNRATFECYEADTGKSLDSVGMSNILKQTSDTSDFVSGKERRGESFRDIFTGLEQDA